MPAEHATCPAGSAAPPIEITALHGRTAPLQLLENAGDETIDTHIVEIDYMRGLDIARPLGPLTNR